MSESANPWHKPDPFNLIFENKQVFPDDMPEAGQSVFQPVHKNYRYVLFVNLGITMGILLLGAIIWLAFSGSWKKLWIDGVVLGGWLFLLIVRMLFAYMRYRHYGYAMRTHDILFKSGWIFKRWIAVPFNRVQHVEIKKSPVEDLFDLSRLKIYTAGGSGSDATIPGLSHEHARRLKHYIMNTIGEDEEE